MEENLLKAIFENTSEGIIVVDNEFSIISLNRMAAHILGLSKQILMKTSIKGVFDNYELVENCTNTGTSYKRQDCIFTVGENKIRCVTNISSIKEGNKVIGVILNFSDTKHIHRVVNNVVGFKATFTFDDILTRNEHMIELIEYAKKAANTGCNILLEGNSGTGKEVFAQAIHNYSYKSKGPFVAVNCAAIPRELFESELFGYERGAFTGAKKGGYPGKFELADGGTIFLDEIGELPLDIQSKLLRVLDNHKIVRVGATYEKKIDVRVIAATNRKLIDEIEKKNFRYDLYYRLNVIGIRLMDLKSRKEDIELLAKYFIDKLNVNNFESRKILGEKFLEKLKECEWDGNVRELRNAIEKVYHLCDDNIIEEDLILLLKNNPKCKGYLKSIHNIEEPIETKKIIPIKTLEADSIKNALRVLDGNAEEAAKALGISRATIYRKIDKYNIKQS